MKLRIARKMDTGGVGSRRLAHGDKRQWWTVYTDDQLRRAEVRLRQSWSRRNPPVGEDRRRNVSPDWFAANRVESRLARQRALRRSRRILRGLGLQ